MEVIAAILAAAVAATAAAEPRHLRVCADPNNLPFSNEAGEGFENALAELVAKDLNATIEYVWKPQRRGFVRTTLGAGLCDVMIGAPVQYDRILATAPYYRSTYVIVTRADREHKPKDLDDPLLKDLRIGVQIVGDDYNNTPPAEALARRGLAKNVVGFSVYGDYAQPNPPARIIDAVEDGEIDVAIAWGPLAGYFASKAKLPLSITLLEADSPAWPFAYDIAMGVKKGNDALRAELDAILVNRQADVDAILDRYGVVRASPAPRPRRRGNRRTSRSPRCLRTSRRARPSP
ncbi:MAG TPA: quinoprotein dehydrogenase-associated putative ABC transporter substrate-binding protein [Candidatus Polarisedimenticolaceae bacterium]|nr:quinoprotein dehydrogenase-associated putative ABC transporter substrate-binding protein [Candidatus Polarisedimenticolaceae bacterium]